MAAATGDGRPLDLADRIRAARVREVHPDQQHDRHEAQRADHVRCPAAVRATAPGPRSAHPWARWWTIERQVRTICPHPRARPPRTRLVACPTSPTPTCCRSAPTRPPTACSPRGREHRGGRRAHLPAGGPRGPAAAGLRGDPRHPAPAAPGPPGPAAPHPRRPRGQPERPLRRPGPAQERQHRRRRRAAHVPGHRHRDRHGQARPAGAHRGPRRGGPVPRHLRRLPDPEPALLPAGPADHVGRAQHRHQPAGPDRALRRHRARPRAGLQVPRHGQGRRQRQQVVPLPGDQGPAEPGLDDQLPRREAAQPGHRGLPAVPPGRGHRRHQRRVRPEDRQVRLGEVPRRPAHVRQRRAATPSATWRWRPRSSP